MEHALITDIRRIAEAAIALEYADGQLNAALSNGQKQLIRERNAKQLKEFLNQVKGVATSLRRSYPKLAEERSYLLNFEEYSELSQLIMQSKQLIVAELLGFLGFALIEEELIQV